MRLKHFFLMVHEYNAANDERNRLISELFRMQTTDLININLKEEKRLKPTQLWHFPWDDDNGNALEAHLSTLKKEEFEENYKTFLGLT